MTASSASATRPQELGGAGAPRTRVWDLPTRLFHWALAVAVIGMIITGLNDIMAVHYAIGYCVLSLILFRLVWGFVGGRWSRFAAFVYSPASLVGYLRGRPHPDHLIGHSPLGALSVFALLVLLAAQVATGLVSDDRHSAKGPLTTYVAASVVRAATHWHGGLGKVIVISLVSLHILAVLFYVLVKRRRLVRPMISGDKLDVEGHTAPSRDDAASRLLALAIYVVCAGFAAWVASLRV